MKKLLKFSGLILGIFFLAYAFYYVNWRDFLNSIEHINIFWFVLTGTAFTISMFLRSVRWQIIIGLPRSATAKVWEAACVGYLGNAIYPARAGDALKVLRLKNITNISSGLAFGSLIIDRILDGLGLCALIILSIIFWNKLFHIPSSIWLVAALFLFTSCLIVLLCYKGHYFEAIFSWCTRKFTKAKWIEELYRQSLTGLMVLKSSHLIFKCLIAQLFITTFDILTCWLLLYAFGWTELPFFASIVMLIYLAAAFSLPSTPGYVGVYQIAAVLALSSFGIEKSAAIAYGTVLQTLTFVLFLGFGLPAQLRKFKESEPDLLHGIEKI